MAVYIGAIEAIYSTAINGTIAKNCNKNEDEGWRGWLHSMDVDLNTSYYSLGMQAVLDGIETSNFWVSVVAAVQEFLDFKPCLASSLKITTTVVSVTCM